MNFLDDVLMLVKYTCWGVLIALAVGALVRL